MALMKSWNIGKRLIFGFAGVTLITLCVSIYALMRSKVRPQNWPQRAFPVRF